MPHCCEGVVLRRMPFSESSLIVVLFSREFGRIDALAKGCRRERSVMRGHLDLFSVEEALVYERTRGGLDLVTETQVAEEFVRLRQDPVRFVAACVAGEILQAACMVRDPHPRAYEALAAGLRDLDRMAPVGPVLVRMVLDLLPDLGFQPRLDACADCGAALPGQDALVLSGLRGGLVCPGCSGRAGGTRISARGISALRYLGRGDANAPRRLALPDAEMIGLVGALGRYVEDMLGRGIRSKDLLLALLERSPSAREDAYATRKA